MKCDEAVRYRTHPKNVSTIAICSNLANIGLMILTIKFWNPLEEIYKSFTFWGNPTQYAQRVKLCRNNGAQ